MRKNFFSKTIACAMLLLGSMTMTSCDEILGIFDNPVEVTVNEETNEATITYTQEGATVTVSLPSEVTSLLSEAKSDIAAKGSAEYVVSITSGGIEATSGDNTISVPKVAGSDINLTFDKAVDTSAPLIIKAAETSSATPTEAVDKVTITMPASTGLKLNIDMPETTVTLKATSGTVEYEEVSATTAINTLIIEKGVTIKTLIWKGGNIVVMDGGSIETLGAETNDGATLICNNEGAELRFKFETDTSYGPSIQYRLNSKNKPKNLKVVKGTGDRLYVDVGLREPLETLTIADGAAAYIFDDATVKNIVGEGNATLYIGTYVYSDNQIVRGRQFYHKTTQSVKNLAIDFTPEKISESMKDWDKVIEDIVPFQGKATGETSMVFENCSFSAPISFRLGVNTSQIKNDENGNPVVSKEVTYYCWRYYPDKENKPMVYYLLRDDDFKYVDSDVKDNELDGPGDDGYWTEIITVFEWESIEISDFTGILELKNCKMNGASISATDEIIGSISNLTGVTFKVKIDGTIYTVEKDENNKCVLK